MPNGYQFDLPLFCSYCKNFEAEVARRECTCLGDERPKYMNTIRCEHRALCEGTFDNIYNAISAMCKNLDLNLVEKNYD